MALAAAAARCYCPAEVRAGMWNFRVNLITVQQSRMHKYTQNQVQKPPRRQEFRVPRYSAPECIELFTVDAESTLSVAGNLFSYINFVRIFSMEGFTTNADPGTPLPFRRGAL